MKCAESQPNEITVNNVHDYHAFLTSVIDLIHLDHQTPDWPEKWRDMRQDMPRKVIGLPGPFLHVHFDSGTPQIQPTVYILVPSRLFPSHFSSRPVLFHFPTRFFPCVSHPIPFFLNFP